METSISVLVCGAGPTGLVTALELARRGIDVRIVDAEQKPSQLSKAAVLWRRSLEVLHPSVPVERFTAHGRPVHGIQFEANGSVLQEIDFGGQAGRFPHGLFIPQNKTEAVLNEALESLGVQVEWGTEVKDVSSCEEHVDVHFSDGEQSRFSWLVGADGAHSTVRKCLGIEFPGAAIDQRWLLADLKLVEAGQEDRIRMFLSTAGLLGLFPYGNGVWRVIADAGPIDPETPRVDPTCEDILHILHSRSGLDWTVEKARWLSEFRINERQVDHYCHGRVILAGDAAHIHSPAGGQGMNTSIQDAVNLSWKLAMVIKNQAASALLTTYQDERHPVGAAVVEGSGRMLRVMMSRNPLIRFFRRWVLPYIVGLPPMRKEAVNRLSEVDVEYCGGPLAPTGADRWIGRRCPDVVWGDDGSSVYDLFTGTGCTVVRLGRGSIPDALWERVIRAAGPDVILVDAAMPDGAVAEEAKAFAQALAAADGTIVVVRPDSYLGPVSQDIEVVVSWFRQLHNFE